MRNRLILSRFFYLASVLSLLICFGCGDTEDEQEAISPTNPIRSSTNLLKNRHNLLNNCRS